LGLNIGDRPTSTAEEMQGTEPAPSGQASEPQAKGSTGFSFPTQGYLGTTKGGTHLGVDIWTQPYMTPESMQQPPQGEPVYLVADGTLVSISDGVTTSARNHKHDGTPSVLVFEHTDPLNPARKIYSHYFHMADEASGKTHIAESVLACLRRDAAGRPITDASGHLTEVRTWFPKGTILGYQGNRRWSKDPRDREDVITHLHFDLRTAPFGTTAVDPSQYLGFALAAAGNPLCLNTRFVRNANGEATISPQISPASFQFGSSGGQTAVRFSPTYPQSWRITGGSAWIRVSASMVTGPGSVTVTALSYSGTSPRVGELIIAGQRFTVRQDGVGAAPSSQVPQVRTSPASAITSLSATLQGLISSPGSSPVVERRFRWGTTSQCSLGEASGVAVSGTSFSFTLTNLRPGTTYYYCAAARNGAGWGEGPVLTFTTTQVQTPLLPAPDLLAPGPGEIGVSATPTLQWSRVVGANRYWVLVSETESALPVNPNASSCTQCVYKGYTDATQLSVALQSGRTYYWRVQGFDNSQSQIKQGQYSLIRSFTTAAAAPAAIAIKQVEVLTPNSILAGNTFSTVVQIDGTSAPQYLYGASIKQSGNDRTDIVLTDPRTALIPCTKTFMVPLGTPTGWYDLTVWVARDQEPRCMYNPGDDELARKTVSRALFIYKFVANDPIRVCNTGGAGAPIIDNMGGSGTAIGIAPEGSVGAIGWMGLGDTRPSDGEYYWVVALSDGRSGWIADKYLAKN